jgi:rhombotail lipoprotein
MLTDRWVRALWAVCLLCLGGCASQTVHHSSSVVDYLYPRAKQEIIQPSVPTLRLPLKVGLAFVPERRSQSEGGFWNWSRAVAGPALTEARKTALLETLASHFRRYDFVGTIEVIPSAYLTQAGGFSNLDQLRTMYGVDVVALVSYDQVQFTDEGVWSLSYWTLVGAYVVTGEKNDTSTLMDTAVYDVASRKMLFRAPGTSQIKGSSTPVNLAQALREDSAKSFELANGQMVANLDTQLTAFRQRVKERPEEVRVERAPGYSGGGALGVAELILAGLACVWVGLRWSTGFGKGPPQERRADNA